MANESTGKGRPTPKRKISEAKRITSSLAPVVTKDQKRAAKEASRQDRVASRAAYLRGEESALPVRDRGPERRFVRNHYNELRASFIESDRDRRRFDVVFRVFDDGVGFRYAFPKQPAMDVVQIEEEAVATV